MSERKYVLKLTISKYYYKRKREYVMDRKNLNYF